MTEQRHLASPGPSHRLSGSRPKEHRTRPGRSRVGGLWVASILFTLVLLLLLIFVLENSQTADVAFFGVHAHVSVGVALLLAAVFGVLLVALPGTVRIMQLRVRNRRTEPPADVPPQPSYSDGDS